MRDHETQRYVHMKTEAALARLALQRLCEEYGLDIDNEIYDKFDDKGLFAEMKKLQLEAIEYAEKVLGEPDPCPLISRYLTTETSRARL